MSISNGKFQGVTRYYELNEKMISAHRRVVAGMGGQVFQEMVLDKFGLVLDDESVTSVATPLGWNSQWLGTRQARPPVPASHDITAMLNNAPTGVPVSSQSLSPAPGVARGTIEIGGQRVAVTDVTWLICMSNLS
jgi:hypothetical protein